MVYKGTNVTIPATQLAGRALMTGKNLKRFLPSALDVFSKHGTIPELTATDCYGQWWHVERVVGNGTVGYRVRPVQSVHVS
jgi:hypothetical protein